MLTDCISRLTKVVRLNIHTDI